MKCVLSVFAGAHHVTPRVLARPPARLPHPSVVRCHRDARGGVSLLLSVHSCSARLRLATHHGDVGASDDALDSRAAGARAVLALFCPSILAFLAMEHSSHEAIMWRHHASARAFCLFRFS